MWMFPRRRCGRRRGHLTAAHLRRGNITRHGGVGETFRMLPRRARETDTGVRMLPRRTQKSDRVVRGNVFGDVSATGKHLTAAHLRRGNISAAQSPDGGTAPRVVPGVRECPRRGNISMSSKMFPRQQRPRPPLPGRDGKTFPDGRQCFPVDNAHDLPRTTETGKHFRPSHNPQRRKGDGETFTRS